MPLPKSPLKPCNYPNCPELTDGAYCEKHRKQTNRDYNRYMRDQELNRFYASPAWRQLSRLQLQREPLCAECMRNGRVTPAYIAHHKVEIRAGGERLSLEGLESLCRSCHNRKHNGG